VSIRSLLQHTATVQALVGGTDRMGQPVASWVTRGAYPCAMQAASGREIAALGLTGTEEYLSLWFTPDVVLTEEDRILSVTTRSGQVLKANLDVEHVKALVGRSGEIDHYQVIAKVLR
jgi:hypothetical protein